MNVQAFIDNISFPMTLVELEDFIDEFNVEQILTVDETEWTAPNGQSREILFSFFMRRQRFNELQSWKQK